MNIVVIGGSGLMGKKLVTRLHERGHEAVEPVYRCDRTCSRWGETPCPTRSSVIAAAFSAPRLSCSLLAHCDP
jgi:NAD dependent epimerase/dehydratase family enzyme